MPDCSRCGSEFPKRRGKNKYCLACRGPAGSEVAARRYLLNTGRSELPTTRRCGCGIEIPIRSNNQKFCADCRAISEKKKFARYRLRNPDKVKRAQLATDQKRRHDEARREKMRVYARNFAEARRDDPMRRLHRNVSQRIYSSLRSGKSHRTWPALVGYSLLELRVHLERQFTKGMRWDNIGQWHVDHIVPVASFTFNKAEDAEFRACWAITNLRPLWAAENLKKKDRRLHLL